MTYDSCPRSINACPPRCEAARLLIRLSAGAARLRSAARHVPWLLLLCVALCQPAQGAAAGREYAWVQYVSGGRVEVRAATAGSVCPPLVVDGAPHVMTPRAFKPGALADSPGDFPVTVCAAVLPARARHATVSGRPVPVPKRHPTRIAVLGDTGCRTPLEDCTTTWALPAVAAAIAERHPDLIIHVGDYLYREYGCLIETCGYGWLPWRADFMDVGADRLFPAAPLVLVRGNHEACGRAAKGWFLLFDPGDPPESCLDTTPGWAVDIGAVNLVVLDTSSANDRAPANVETYRHVLDTAGLAVGKPNWLIEHKPVWGMDSAGHWLNETLQAAFGERLRPRVGVILSGHIHTTEVLEMNGRPVQIILGNGGADLAAMVPQQRVAGTSAAGEKVTRAFTREGYGFGLIELDRNGWRMSLIDAQNRAVARCDLHGACAATR